MNKVIHRAETRGYADHGWLKTHHTFSFAGYHNPERVHFGKLRVLNDDDIAPGEGFGTHPHDNMEIVTIVLKGELEHGDSMSNMKVVRPGEIQNMSAGSGITHSEFNHSNSEMLSLLQIWVFPKEKDIKPRYGQKVFPKEDRKNKIQTIVAPLENGKVLYIHQDVFFSLLDLDSIKDIEYKIKTKGNGVYIFVIEGSVEISGEILNRRDGIGIWNTEVVSLKGKKDSYILFIEVPMN